MLQGYRLVEEGLESVRIMGRRPTYIRDDVSPAGEYGWQYGWRWQDDTATASHTVPEAVYQHLGGCPNAEVMRHRAEGRGVMLRWPTEAEALAALDRAAFALMKTQVYIAGRRAEVDALRPRVEQLVAEWAQRTAHLSNPRGMAARRFSEPLTALGPQAVPLLEDLEPKYPALKFVIEAIRGEGGLNDPLPWYPGP